mmetsp:Transcript_48688/g.80656  ORF Transcript_48688/g.80656 Transcript_48688/m.80656 type:complete len:91 (-) Transcript_48688:1053-1325(-)
MQVWISFLSTKEREECAQLPDLQICLYSSWERACELLTIRGLQAEIAGMANNPSKVLAHDLLLLQELLWAWALPKFHSLCDRIFEPLAHG